MDERWSMTVPSSFSFSGEGGEGGGGAAAPRGCGTGLPSFHFAVSLSRGRASGEGHVLPTGSGCFAAEDGDKGRKKKEAVPVVGCSMACVGTRLALGMAIAAPDSPSGDPSGSASLP